MTRAKPASDEFREVATRIYDKLRPRASEIVAMGDEHLPMHQVWERDGTSMLRNVVIPTDRVPKTLIATTHHAIAEVGFVSVLILEAWAAPVPRGEDPNHYKQRQEGGTIANAPGRKEVISFYMARDREDLVAICDVHRDTRTLDRGELIDPLTKGDRGLFIRDP